MRIMSSLSAKVVNDTRWRTDKGCVIVATRGRRRKKMEDLDVDDAKMKRRWVKTMPCDWRDALGLLLGAGVLGAIVGLWYLILCCLVKYLAT